MDNGISNINRTSARNILFTKRLAHLPYLCALFVRSGYLYKYYLHQRSVSDVIADWIYSYSYGINCYIFVRA